jgi:glycine/D-amino acid oxidase-like deaminating enzyme
VRAGGPAPEVAIVGGGIVGTAVAAFLAEAGVSVRLYERTAIAAGASGRNSGIVQHPFDSELAALYRSSLEAYRSVAAGAGLAFPAEPAGLLYVGRDARLATRIAADWSATWPAAVPELIEGRALLALEPALAPDLVACRLSIGYPVGPAAATTAFAGLAEASGVEVVVGDEVGLAVSGDRVTGVTRAGAVEPAGDVVVAAGPWTPRIVDPGAAWRPIRPSWGVVASIVVAGAPRHGLEAIDIDIEPGSSGAREADGIAPSDELVDFSLVPGDGSSSLGSTFLPTEPEAGVWIDALRSVGGRYVPAVATAPVVGVRHCARPVSRDGRPLVGRVPWLGRAWVAAGHGPWGISTGPGTARLLAEAILAGDDAAIPAALAPARFGMPAPRSSTGVSATTPRR